jgi:dihydroneopterin aldolase
MDIITIADLEVSFHIGVPDAEREHPQRLLLTVEIEHDVDSAARRDDLTHTVDYGAVSRRLIAMGQGKSWKLIETLAVEISRVILSEFKADTVTVEVKKFIIPQARHVSVRIRRTNSADHNTNRRINSGAGGVPGGWQR